MSFGPFEIGKNNGRGFQLRPSICAPILEFKIVLFIEYLDLLNALVRT